MKHKENWNKSKITSCNFAFNFYLYPFYRHMGFVSQTWLNRRPNALSDSQIFCPRSQIVKALVQSPSPRVSVSYRPLSLPTPQTRIVWIGCVWSVFRLSGSISFRAPSSRSMNRSLPWNQYLTFRKKKIYDKTTGSIQTPFLLTLVLIIFSC